MGCIARGAAAAAGHYVLPLKVRGSWALAAVCKINVCTGSSMLAALSDLQAFLPCPCSFVNPQWHATLWPAGTGRWRYRCGSCWRWHTCTGRMRGELVIANLMSVATTSVAKQARQRWWCQGP